MEEEVIYYYRALPTDMRWDQAAAWGWGDPYLMDTLVADNPNVPTYSWIPAGVVLAFRYIDNAALNPLPSQLPAWKQTATT